MGTRQTWHQTQNNQEKRSASPVVLTPARSGGRSIIRRNANSPMGITAHSGAKHRNSWNRDDSNAINVERPSVQQSSTRGGLLSWQTLHYLRLTAQAYKVRQHMLCAVLHRWCLPLGRPILLLLMLGLHQFMLRQFLHHQCKRPPSSQIMPWAPGLLPLPHTRPFNLNDHHIVTGDDLRASKVRLLDTSMGDPQSTMHRRCPHYLRCDHLQL